MHNPVVSLYRYITVVVVIGVMILASILHKMIESLRTLSLALLAFPCFSYLRLLMVVIVYGPL